MRTGQPNDQLQTVVPATLAQLQRELQQASANLTKMRASFENSFTAFQQQFAELELKINGLMAQSNLSMVEHKPAAETILDPKDQKKGSENLSQTESLEQSSLQISLQPTEIIPIDTEWLRQTFSQAPKIVTEMRQNLHYFLRHTQEVGILKKISLQASEVATAGAAFESNPVTQIAAGLERLIADLLLIPGQMSKGALRTAGQSLEFTALLLEEQNLEKLQAVRLPLIVSVDDEPSAHQQVIASMKTLGAQVIPIGCSHDALDLLNGSFCNLIMLDLNMPGINGLDLCRKIRALESHKQTPILFVTGAASVENRAQSSLNGGNDFIAKPFQLTELALKALLWIYKGQFGLI